MQNSPIEVISNVLESHQDKEEISVTDVLVPEQCLMVVLHGKTYHLTLEEVPE